MYGSTLFGYSALGGSYMEDGRVALQVCQFGATGTRLAGKMTGGALETGCVGSVPVKCFAKVGPDCPPYGSAPRKLRLAKSASNTDREAYHD